MVLLFIIPDCIKILFSGIYALLKERTGIIMNKKTKTAVLAGTGALLAGNAVYAALHKPKKKELMPFEQENVNVQRYTEVLQGAIRCKTVSNPDEDKMDWGEFEKLHKLFEEKYPLIHSKLKKEIIGKAGLVFVWEGKDPSLKPIALIGHQDVVPVPKEKVADWIHPPFSGDIDDGCLWGRGTTDMKHHVVAVLESVETLLEDGFEPTRTVYLCFGYNEEVVDTEKNSATIIANTLKERGIELESVLDEGGAVLDLKVPAVINRQVMGIGIAEKGYCDFEISIDAKGGHSAAPPDHSAVGELAKAITRLENHQFKARILPEFSRVADILSRNLEYPARLVGAHLKPLLSVMKPVITKIPPAATFVRTTTAVTMTSGSPQANVLPQKATATINFRVLPGNTIADVEKHIRKVVKNKKVNVRFIGGNEPSNISPIDTDSFKAIDKVCSSIHRNSMTVPFIVMGGTDSRHYQIVTDQIYRFSPFLMKPDYLMLGHGTNERVPVDCFEGGLNFFKKYIKTMAG